MFKDRYDLTNLVFRGFKTITRDVMKAYKGPISFANCLERLKNTEYEDENGDPYIPRFYVGEIVAIAERYAYEGEQGHCADPPRLIYKCDYPSCVSEGIDKNTIPSINQVNWENKMFMPASFCRKHIKILSITPERLQDITDEDCIKEGIRFIDKIGLFYFEDTVKDEGFYFKTPREAFAALIDKVWKKGIWESNPYVWRIEFELTYNI